MKKLSSYYPIQDIWKALPWKTATFNSKSSIQEKDKKSSLCSGAAKYCIRKTLKRPSSHNPNSIWNALISDKHLIPNLGKG